MLGGIDAGATGDDGYTDGYSDSLLKSLAIIPKFTSVLSIAGSSWIILEVLSEREKQKLVYHRMLFMFAVINLISSIGIFLTTWPIPRGTEDTFAAVGTVATCEMQGFLIQLAIALPIYNAMLSIYYVMVIRYNVSEERVKKYYEIFFHGIPIIFCLSTSIAALSLQMYNEANLWCWISAFPDGCLHSKEIDSEDEDSTSTCVRGDGAYIWRYGVFYAPLWLCFIIVLVCMWMVWRGVKTQENRMAQFDPALRFTITPRSNGDVNATAPKKTRASFSETVGRFRKRMNTMTSSTDDQAPQRSWQVLTQCMCYVLAFYLCHIFGSVVRMQQQISGETNVVLLLLHCFLTPLQGFLNFAIYRRPLYLRLRRKHPLASRFRAVKKCLIIKKFKRSPTNQYGDDGDNNRCSRCCSWWNKMRRPRFIQGSAVVVAATPSMAERLEEIRNSERFSERQRHLATLAEMDVIIPPSVRFSLPEDDDEEDDDEEDDDEEDDDHADVDVNKKDEAAEQPEAIETIQE